MEPVNEWFLVWMVPLRILIVLVFALLYAIGGRKWKWIRRFVGGLFLGGALIGLSLMLGAFNWWLLGVPAMYVIVLCLGYGGDTPSEKFIRRLIYGAAFGGVGLYVGIVSGVWLVGLFQFVLAVFASVFFGLANPVQAVNEEALIATLSVVCVPFMI